MKLSLQVDEALLLTENEKEVMVIGGASLCEQLLPKVNRLYITRIDSEFEGDIYFPTYDASSWHQVSVSLIQKILQITTPIILLF